MTARMKVPHSFRVDATLLATIAESWRLLATTWSERVNSRQDALLANSRAAIAESRRLLATLELSASTSHDMPHAEPTLVPAAPIAPDRAQDRSEADRDPAALSVRIFQGDARFCWTVRGRENQILGRGMAETEMKARVDAFCAGMIYLDWTKNRLASDDTSLH